MRIELKDLITWGGLVFAAGGSYFMLNNHDKRLEKLEGKEYVEKSDYKEDKKSIWEALRRR